MTKGQEAVNRSQELLEKIEALATPPLPVQPVQEPVGEGFFTSEGTFTGSASKNIGYLRLAPEDAAAGCTIGLLYKAAPLPVQEPVACVHVKDGLLVGSHRDTSKPFPDGQYGLWPIHTTPPLPVQPERQPLTDEKIKSICVEKGWDSSWQSMRFARAIEAAHNIGGATK